MQASRVLGLAAVLFKGVCAGTMESRKGSASETPMPRNTVRRDRCFLVMYIRLRFLFETRVRFKKLAGSRASHAKRPAFDDCDDERRKLVVVARCLSFYRAYERHVGRLQPAARGVRKQILAERSEKRIAMIQDRAPQTRRSIELRSVEHLAGRINRQAAILG